METYKFNPQVFLMLLPLLQMSQMLAAGNKHLFVSFISGFLQLLVCFLDTGVIPPFAAAWLLPKAKKQSEK